MFNLIQRLKNKSKVKFYIYEGSEFKLITLKDKEDHRESYYNEHDEGFNSGQSVYTFYADEQMVYLQSDYSGRDCDGKHSESTTYFCPVKDLRKLTASNARYQMPDWQVYNPTTVYDQFAQEMGY